MARVTGQQVSRIELGQIDRQRLVDRIPVWPSRSVDTVDTVDTIFRRPVSR